MQDTCSSCRGRRQGASVYLLQVSGPLALLFYSNRTGLVQGCWEIRNWFFNESTQMIHHPKVFLELFFYYETNIHIFFVLKSQCLLLCFCQDFFSFF